MSRCHALRGAACRLAAVYPLAQLLAGFEEGYRLLVHRNCLAGARMAPGSGIAPLHGKRAEAAQFDPFAPRQCIGDLIEDGCDDQFHIRTPQVWIVGGKFDNQFRFCHAPVPGCFRPDVRPPEFRQTIQPPERCQMAHAPSRITPWENTLFQMELSIQPRLEESARLAKPVVGTSSTGRSADTPLGCASQGLASVSPPIASIRSLRKACRPV